MKPSEEYLSGFSRALLLRNPEDLSKYSQQFRTALEQYFDAYGLLDHPKFSEWWLDHLSRRVAHAFNVFIPWCFELSINFDGSNVLEIGCGTGSSTIALAAYSNSVVACDIHRPSLEVARLRLQEDGFSDKVTFLLLDSGMNELTKISGQFDIVVLYGVLEHMLPSERERIFDVLASLLAPKGKIVVYDTPNRLWPKDEHTTDLWGWPWLSPNWALRYGKLRGRFASRTDLTEMRRLGVGITYSDLLKLLKRFGLRYRIRHKYIPEPFHQRFFIKTFVTVLRAPRWGLSKYLNVVIEKL